LLDEAHDRFDCDAARDFARVVSAHAVRQNEEADVGIDADRVLVVLTDTTHIAQADRADFPAHYRARHRFASVSGGALMEAATRVEVPPSAAWNPRRR